MIRFFLLKTTLAVNIKILLVRVDVAMVKLRYLAFKSEY